MTDDPSDGTPDDENPAIHGSESGPGESTGDSTGDGAGGDVRTTPALADQGKDVVDTRGADVGMVSDVDGETLYVDPDPDLTESVMSKLHWRDHDRDDHPVPPEAIERIGDEVVLDVEFDPEVQDPSDPGSRA